MTNLVYEKDSNIPMTPQELADAANAITTSHPFTAADFAGPKSRIAGAGHCDCGGNGKFELLPINHPDVQEGGKRYMICRICGGVSHL